MRDGELVEVGHRAVLCSKRRGRSIRGHCWRMLCRVIARRRVLAQCRESRPGAGRAYVCRRCRQYAPARLHGVRSRSCWMTFTCNSMFARGCRSRRAQRFCARLMASVWSWPPARRWALSASRAPGKTTLARAALRLIRAESGTRRLARPVSGRRCRDPESELRPLRRDIQESSFFRIRWPASIRDMTAGQIIAEPLQIHQPELELAPPGSRRGLSAALARVRVISMQCFGKPLPASAQWWPMSTSGHCPRDGFATACIGLR